MPDQSATNRPLEGLRIIDGVTGPLTPITRYLAELGAVVVRTSDLAAGADRFEDAASNNGKVWTAFAMDDPGMATELARADAVVMDAPGLPDLAALRQSRPTLVTMIVSDFGTDTDFADWQATDPVLHALSGELSRSGLRGRPPLIPPGSLAIQCAAAQAAYVLISALYGALRTGQGEHFDFSALDGAVQALDPGFGISGSATMGKPAHLLAPGRPVRGFQYPILPCADGHVRICLLSKKQWLGMFRWMGEPPEFGGAELEKTSVRYKTPELLPAIGRFFADRTRADLEEEGQRHGVPISGLQSFSDCMAAEHMRIRAAFTHETLSDGTPVVLPNGMVTIDDERMGPVEAKTGPIVAWPSPQVGSSDLPFAGLRVLDLGVIVVGAEQGRLLADGGADVVKIESRANPDGNRQSYLTYGMSVSFAAGHRNKRSLGINLRDPAGRELFLKLAATADVVLSNFKPGTMESLGLGRDTLLQVNSRAVLVESSAFGDTGPWSARMGYGPLVRAATGLTELWRYPDDPESFSDSVTIYPDHVAARIGAIAAVALLIRRLHSGRGGTASIAQSEVMLGHFAADVARASAGTPTNQPPDWPWSVYRAAGDDEWCVVTVRDDADWRRLAAVIDFPEADALSTSTARLSARAKIDSAMSEWLAPRDPGDAMHLLQRAGVPAARMLRVQDLPGFAYYRQRGLFRVETHPYLQEDVIAERWAGKRAGAGEAPARPAPLAGEQTAAIVTEWLGPAPDTQDLIDRGVLEPLERETHAAALAGARGATRRGEG